MIASLVMHGEAEVKIVSWNVDGIGDWITEGGLAYLREAKPDILLLQDVRIGECGIPNLAKNVPGYVLFYQGATPHKHTMKEIHQCVNDRYDYMKRYKQAPRVRGGVAMYTRVVPERVTFGFPDAHRGSEPEVMTAEFTDFLLVNALAPRDEDGLARRGAFLTAIRRKLLEVRSQKPVICAGSFQVSLTEMDVAESEHATSKMPGFRKAERGLLRDLVVSGFRDAFRTENPCTRSYTMWRSPEKRLKNSGWRTDCMFVSDFPIAWMECVHETQHGVGNHCPVRLCFVPINY
jgi:exodeoxyribonuclease III